MKIAGFFLLVISFLVACHKEYDHKGKDPLAEVAGQFLYKEDLQAVLPPNLSKDDSILFAEHYIKNWIENTLLFEKAESNIPDNTEIDRLVENYRKALVTHAYQQALIDQKVSKEIGEKEIIEYYEQNKQLFVLEAPLIKGVFIKVPLGAPGINNVRAWYKKNIQDAADKLEKYSLRNAVEYDYFYDKWILAVELIDKIPLKVQNPENYLKENRHIEVKDTAYQYFLHVSEFLDEGGQEPFEFAKVKAKNMLVNLKQIEFLRDVKGDLYKNALDGNKIKYYNKKE